MKTIFMPCKIMKNFIIILSILLSFECFSQITNYNFSTENRIYNENIKTVRIHPENWEIGQPVLNLYSDNRLLFSFDQIESQPEVYYYDIIHCDRNWNISNISPVDYKDVFHELEITNWEDSYSTMVQYTHYKLYLPNEDINLKISGNYVLVVYTLNENVKNIVCTQRFMVYEPLVDIIGDVSIANVSDYKSYFQKVDFKINKKNYRIDDPFREVKVVVMQNFQWDNAVTDIQPTFIDNNFLTYQYDDKIIFNAANEYRYFNFNNLEVFSENIENIEFKKPYYYIDLVKDKNRMFDPYSSAEDINGKYIIKTNRFGNRSKPEVEAEYAIVKFRLEMPNPLSAWTVYLYGNFAGNQLTENYKMKYNPESRCYETLMFLKQGYYNYRYVAVKWKDGKNISDHSFLEGSHKQTENDYYIFVYHKAVSDNYDKLIGYKVLNSVKK